MKARHYGEALDVIRARIVELDITYDTVDELAGLPLRYTSKCLCVPPKKHYSVFSLFSTWGALGLAMHGAEDVELTQRAKTHSQFRKRKYRAPVRAQARMTQISPEFRRMIAAKGGVARAAKLSPKRRSAIARKAIRARWAKTAEPAAMGLK